MTKASELLIKLVRVSLGDGTLAAELASGAFQEPDDWAHFLDLASSQGVGPLVDDALQHLSNLGLRSSLDGDGNEELRYSCFRDILESERQFERYTSTIAKFMEGLSRRGVERVLMLKGYGAALDYPVPAHRTLGDIDIFALDGKCAEVEAALSTLKRYSGRITGRERHSHAVFRGVSVENHFRFTNASGSCHDSVLETVLLDEADRSSRPVEIGGAKVFLPSADFNALFLIWHMAQHFTLEKVNMRQLCDWFIFLQKHSSEVDWDRVVSLWETSRRKRFADVVNGVMISYFGMQPSLVPPFRRLPEDEKRFMEFVLESPPLATQGIEAVLKYWRRRWNFRLAHGSHWFGSLWTAVFNHLR